MLCWCGPGVVSESSPTPTTTGAFNHNCTVLLNSRRALRVRRLSSTSIPGIPRQLSLRHPAKRRVFECGVEPASAAVLRKDDPAHCRDRDDGDLLGLSLGIVARNLRRRDEVALTRPELARLHTISTAATAAHVRSSVRAGGCAGGPSRPSAAFCPEPVGRAGSGRAPSSALGTLWNGHKRGDLPRDVQQANR
jgi:hypothetical protein